MIMHPTCLMIAWISLVISLCGFSGAGLLQSKSRLWSTSLKTIRQIQAFKRATAAACLCQELNHADALNIYEYKLSCQVHSWLHAYPSSMVALSV